MNRKRFDKTILIVEDDVISKKIILKFLEIHGFKTLAAENGIEAVEIYSKNSIDLVLMDVRMPEMDGFMATSEIRLLENQSTKHVPVIAVTACALHGDKEKCLDAGMDDYITKPVDLVGLLDTINKWLKK